MTQTHSSRLSSLAWLLVPIVFLVSSPSAWAAGKIYALDQNGGLKGGVLFEVDLSGHRTVLTGFGKPAVGIKPRPQPLGKAPRGVAVAPDGTIFVVDAEAHGRGVLFAVDPATGLRRIFSDFSDSTQGPLGREPSGVAVGADGTILVIDHDAGSRCLAENVDKVYGEHGNPGCGALFVVDSAGRRFILSDFG